MCLGLRFYFPIFSRVGEIFLQWHRQAFAAHGLPKIDPEHPRAHLQWESVSDTWQLFLEMCSVIHIAYSSCAVGIIGLKMTCSPPSDPHHQFRKSPWDTFFYTLFSGNIILIISLVPTALSLPREAVVPPGTDCLYHGDPPMSAEHIVFQDWMVYVYSTISHIFYHCLNMFAVHNLLIWKWMRINEWTIHTGFFPIPSTNVSKLFSSQESSVSAYSLNRSSGLS